MVTSIIMFKFDTFLNMNNFEQNFTDYKYFKTRMLSNHSNFYLDRSNKEGIKAWKADDF